MVATVVSLVVLPADAQAETMPRDLHVAAALFAVTLEMQGHDEATITRVLDQTFTDDEMALSDISAIRGWLDACRHRFDVALTAMRQ
jgi:hypothetical protein